MSNIKVSDNPEFTTDMTALELQTPAYAPTFNAMFKQCLENDAANRRDAKILDDTANSKKYQFGVENGVPYLEEISNN